MKVTTDDVAWFNKELQSCDAAGVKLFYLNFALPHDSNRLSSENPLGYFLQEGEQIDIPNVVPVARLVACDERTLWECVGPSLYRKLESPIDLWNEQLAVKVLCRYLDFCVGNVSHSQCDVRLLREELAIHTAQYLKPQGVSAVYSRHQQAHRTAVNSVVAVVPMDEGDAHSEGALVCVRTAEAFEELLRVSRNDMFYRHTVLQFSELGKAVQGTPRLVSVLENEEALLLMGLIYETFVVGVEHSHWRPLLASCPASYPTVPAFWDVSDLCELEGLDVLDDVLQRRRQLDVFSEEVLETLPIVYDALSNKPEGLSLEGLQMAFTAGPIRWARATFDSRAFRLNVDGEVVLALVPFADMINHNNRSDILVRKVESGGGDFVMQLGAALKSPEDVDRELWMSYGPLQNWELLQFYGFVLDDNVHDKLPFPLQLQQSATPDVWEQRCYALVHRFSLHMVQRCWIASNGQPSEALQALLRIFVAEADEFDRLEAAGPFQPLSMATECAVVNTMEQTLQCVLEQFPTSLEEDLELLLEVNQTISSGGDGAEENVKSDPQALPNLKLCVRLRIALKKIAHRALQWCAAARKDFGDS